MQLAEIQGALDSLYDIVGELDNNGQPFERGDASHEYMVIQAGTALT